MQHGNLYTVCKCYIHSNGHSTQEKRIITTEQDD